MWLKSLWKLSVVDYFKQHAGSRSNLVNIQHLCILWPEKMISRGSTYSTRLLFFYPSRGKADLSHQLFIKKESRWEKWFTDIIIYIKGNDIKYTESWKFGISQKKSKGKWIGCLKNQGKSQGFTVSSCWFSWHAITFLITQPACAAGGYRIRQCLIQWVAGDYRIWHWDAAARASRNKILLMPQAAVRAPPSWHNGRLQNPSCHMHTSCIL